MEQKQLSEDLDNVWYIFLHEFISNISCSFLLLQILYTLMDDIHLIDDVYFANVISGSRCLAVFL